MNTCQGLLIVALLALSLQQGVAVRCYMCSSEYDPTCKDKFIGSQHESQLTYCSRENLININTLLPGLYTNFGFSNSQREDFECVKAVKREHDREVVVRSCTIPRADSFDVCSQLKSRNLVYCQTCTTDACNSATLNIPVILLPALCATLLALRANKY